MTTFRILDLSQEQPPTPPLTEVEARTAEQAGEIVLGVSLTRHPGGRGPVRAKAYCQRDSGLTMVRLYLRSQ